MESKKVHALLTAAKAGSLTAAAAELGYTQAGLTQMMNSLENELGVNLLLRGKGGVRLSAAGQSLLDELGAFVSAADALEHAAAALRNENISTIRIGAYASISRQWLPAILSDFRHENPQIDTSISVGSIEQMYNGVKDETLDCAFVSYQPLLLKGLNWFPLQVDELLAVLPPDYPAEGEDFPIESFSGTDFLMPSQGFDLDIAPLFSLPEHKVLPHVRYTNMDDPALISMTEHGLGLTILSRLIMQSSSAAVKTLPLRPRSHRSLGMIISSKRQSEHVLRSFVRSSHGTVDHMYQS